MNDAPLHELDDCTRRALGRWRAEPEPAAPLAAALERLRRADLPQGGRRRPGPRWRPWRWRPRPSWCWLFPGPRPPSRP